MACCKCEEYKWEDPQEVVHTDPEDGKEYCLFHAPAEHKWKSIKNQQKMSVDEFNVQLFRRIQDVADLNEEFSTCNLSGTIFPGDIAFVAGSTFPHISFRGSEFKGAASFKGAHLESLALFDAVRFGGRADFNLARLESSDFRHARFMADAIFDGAQFDGSTSFKDAHFEGNAYFNKVQFKKYVSFKKSIFRRDVYFGLALFERRAEFWDTRFEGKADFYSIMTSEKATLQFDSCIVSLASAPFRKCDPTCLDLAGQRDLANIHFIDAPWEKNGQRIKACTEDDPDKLQSTRDFYQRMKAKYKAENNEYEASKWHIAEKEAQLKLLAQKKDERFNWFALWLYKLVSGFGENPGRAFGVLASLLAVPLLFCSMDIEANFFGLTFHSHQVVDPIAQWLKYIPLTRAMDGETSSGWRALMFFWQLLITLQAALFAFALRNNFRR